MLVRVKALARPSFEMVLLVTAVTIGCSDGRAPTPPGIEIGSITINSAAFAIERGNRATLTATSRDRQGQEITVPIAWRSGDESIASFERGGVLVAHDTGTTIILASSLGVLSQGVAVRVVWFGAARIDTVTWRRPSALNPGATLSDSVRVRVTNIDGNSVANAIVRFTVSEGGGSISPILDTTDASGRAAAQWTIGDQVGINKVSASVVRADGALNPFVENNAAVFSIRSYHALTIRTGDDQTGTILKALPVAPSVLLVDSLGAPRAGVPIVFLPSANGHVTSSVVSTDAAGVASPGTWTLGDIPGEQSLEARVADAKVIFSASATGTPTYYRPARVVAGEFSTCALESDGAIKCWGESPQNGSGTASASSSPTPVNGTVTGTSLEGGPSHFCLLAVPDSRAWCWGRNAIPDTTGAIVTTSSPTRVQSDTAWSAVAPGAAHNCALTSAQLAYCWGSNAFGQLGDPPTVGGARFTIRPVAGSFTFTQLASGAQHSCGLSAGAAFCWGSNQNGRLGDGTTANRDAPTAVAGGQAFLQIGAGDTFSCGLTAQNRAYCWGALGGNASLSPTTYADAPSFTKIAVGGSHVCAMSADNEVYCWGNNAWGQLGDSSQTTRSTPIKVAGSLRFTQLSAGLQHTCGLTTDGAVACWGRNRGGEMGESTAPFRTAPKHVVQSVQP